MGKKIRKAYCAIDNSKKADINREIGEMDMKVSALRVAYANHDTVKESQDRILYCGNAKNEHFKDIYEYKSMVGYVKDSAWSYEKELRLRIDITGSIKCTGILVEIPDYVMNSIQIMKGPRFIGDLKIKIQEEIEKNFILETSLYFKKLRTIPCDNCKMLKRRNDYVNRTM